MIKKDRARPLQCKIFHDFDNNNPKTVEEFRELVRLIDYWNKHWLKGIVKNYSVYHIENYTTYSSDLTKEFEYVKKANEFKNQAIKIIKTIQLIRKIYLSEINKEVAGYIENGETDKYIQFKIGDVFDYKSGSKSFNKSLSEGTATIKKGEINKFPFYTSMTKGNHINGYYNESNIDIPAIKISSRGAEAGTSILIKGDNFLGQNTFGLFSQIIIPSETIALIIEEILKDKARGTAVPVVNISGVLGETIAIPVNHAELSQYIKKLNDWEQYLNELNERLEEDTWKMIKHQEFKK